VKTEKEKAMYATSSMEFEKSKELLEVQLRASQSDLSKLRKEYQEFQQESLEIKTTLQNERSVLKSRFNQSIRCLDFSPSAWAGLICLAVNWSKT
jgi:hypothetical protein